MLAEILLPGIVRPSQSAAKQKDCFTIVGKIIGIGAGTVSIQISSGNTAIKAYPK